MQLEPVAEPAELDHLFDGVVDRSSHRWVVRDADRLRESVMPRLAAGFQSGSGSVRAASAKAVRQIANWMGTPFATPHSLLACIARDGNDGMIIPVVETAFLPFELAGIIIDAANEMEVGPLLFGLPGSADIRDPVCGVMCAAIHRGWQAPVLFQRGEELPAETVRIDWRRMLHANTGDLPGQPLNDLLGPLADRDFDRISPAEWSALSFLPPDAWEALSGELRDAFCDLFEELNVNETFPLLKRYLIPRLPAPDDDGTGWPELYL